MAITSAPLSTQKAMLIALVGSALAAMTVAVGVATWRSAGDSGADSAAVESRAANTTRAPAHDPGEERLTVYLVATSAAADTLRMKLDEGAAVRDALGLAPPNVDFTVVSSAEEEARVTLAINELDLVRGEAGLPPTTLVDLRSQ